MKYFQRMNPESSCMIPPTKQTPDILHCVSPAFTSQLMLHPATHATLSSILLSGVQGYTQSTPSPPPGLAPIDKQSNGVPDCAKASCALNGHIKVSPFSQSCFIRTVSLNILTWHHLGQHPASVYGRISTASLAETVLSPAPCDSVQEASGHNPSEPLSSKSSTDEGTHGIRTHAQRSAWEVHTGCRRDRSAVPN